MTGDVPGRAPTATNARPPGRPERPAVTVTLPPTRGAGVFDPATSRLVDGLAGAVAGEITRAGGAPVGVSPGEPVTLGHGLALVGGGDVDPARYSGEPPHPAVYALSPRQDAFEIDLVRRALADSIPVLGVCRGMQILNVALGGTLTQHLTDPGGRHRGPTLAALFVEHEVDITPGTCLAGIIGRPRIAVASGHHQAVRGVGRDLRVAAIGPDGVIEAIEHTGGWAVGVQWHPEYALGDRRASADLFAGFVAAVRESARRSAPEPETV